MQTLSPEAIEAKRRLIQAHESRHDAERQRLEQLWQAGELSRHLDSLEVFFQRKRQEFLDLLDAEPDELAKVDLAKLLVVEHGIVDQIAETLDQIRAIEAEIWIQGENGNHDREGIACRWSETYASDWRNWRIKEYLFAISRMEDRLDDVFGLRPSQSA
mgnify:CR=1 FL=1